MTRTIKKLPRFIVVMFVCTAFLISSCCSYDEPTLDEIRICGTSPSSDPCEEGLTSLSSNTDFITISALIGAHESTGTVTFNLYFSTESAPIRTEVVNLNSLDDEFEGECGIWLSQGWPSTGTIAASQWRAEVIFNDADNQTLSKNFSIQ